MRDLMRGYNELSFKSCRSMLCSKRWEKKNIAQYMYSLEDYGQPAHGTEESSAEKQLFIYLFI